MSSRWWRAYDESLHDPKLLALSDRLHRAWFNMLCVASKYGGVLPAIATVAIELRMSIARAAEYITELVTAGLLDEVSPGIFAPHNWNGRQFKSDVSTERVKRYRQQQRNVSSQPPETLPKLPHSTETDSEAETEKQETRASALHSDWPKDAFDRFWHAFPNKIGKRAALKSFVVAKRTGVEFERLMVSLERYVAEKPPDRAWCNPTTWLNQGRWDDQPAPNGDVNGTRPHPRRTDESAVLAGLARGLAGRHGDVAGSADEEIPRGRFEFDLGPARGS